jgi:hypothetical protein
MPKIRDGDKTNFETLQRAWKEGNVALMDATRKSDGTQVALVCAMGVKDGMVYPTPLAVMIESNPFEDFTPPEGMEETEGSPNEDGN